MGVLGTGKERALKKGNSTHPDHGNLAQILTKEFLEGKMHDYTQKVRFLRQRAVYSPI